jgi:NUMOD1 domain
MIEKHSMKNNFDFGKNLEKLILTKFKSVAQFSKATGISSKTILGWLGPNGRFPSKPEYIKTMAQALNITVHELMFGHMDSQEPFSALLEKTEIHTGLYEISIKKVTRKD